MKLSDYSCPATTNGAHHWHTHERLWRDTVTGATTREVVYRCVDCGAEKALDPPAWTVER